MDQMTASAVFLCSTILISLGVLVMVGATVIVNNIIHKYWKNLGWKLFETPAYVFVEKTEEPPMESSKKSK